MNIRPCVLGHSPSTDRPASYSVAMKDDAVLWESIRGKTVDLCSDHASMVVGRNEASKLVPIESRVSVS